MTTGYVYHEVFGWHDTGTNAGLFPSNAGLGIQPLLHFENADTKRRMHELIVVSGLIDHLQRITPVAASEDDLLRVHTVEHVERIKNESEQPKGGDSGDGLSPFGQGGYEIGRLAAGGVIEAVKAVVSGSVQNSYALVRPPGHHAVPASGMGFCMFSNLAIAARYAQQVMGVERIAILDWDVHHGNGTQAVFYDDPNVLTISIHQANVFPPNSGALDETGVGAGEGYAINIPLPPGTGDGGYRYAMEKAVLPAITGFGPDLVLVASGFDASAWDPLGRQLLTSDGYRSMTDLLMDAAADLCDGRIAMSHEGGYNPVLVPFCGLAVLESLSGHRVLDDPTFPIVSGMAGHDLKPAEQHVIEAAAALAPPTVASG